jgi:hypothetical protein
MDLSSKNKKNLRKFKRTILSITGTLVTQSVVHETATSTAPGNGE